MVGVLGHGAVTVVAVRGGGVTADSCVLGGDDEAAFDRSDLLVLFGRQRDRPGAIKGAALADVLHGQTLTAGPVRAHLVHAVVHLTEHHAVQSGWVQMPSHSSPIRSCQSRERRPLERR